MLLAVWFRSNCLLRAVAAVSEARNSDQSFVSPNSRVPEILVVDVGSGQGHLARYLSLHCGFKVLSLEMDHRNIQKATKFNRETKAYLEKRLTRNCTAYGARTDLCCQLTYPVVHNTRITTDTSGVQLSDLVSQLTGTNEDERASYQNAIVLTGLHACGDLSTAILRIFNQSDTASAMVVVGCCYMKTVVDTPSREVTQKFIHHSQCGLSSLWRPQSSKLGATKIRFSYPLLEVACHSITDYAKRLYDVSIGGDPSAFHVQGYRAFLELLLVRRLRSLQSMNGVTTAHTTLARNFNCKVKHNDQLDFIKYSTILLRRMAACQTSDVKSCTSLFEPFTSMEIESALESIGTQVSCEQLWLPVVRYHVFRLMLAPAIETIILLDRLLWLQERER